MNLTVFGKKGKAGRCFSALLAVLAVLLGGLLLELFCNLPLFMARAGNETGRQEIALEDVLTEGFSLEDGKLVLTGESGYLQIPLDGRYVGQFGYSYEYDGLMNVLVRLGVRNAYGESSEREAVTLEDRNCRVLDASWIPVGVRLDYAALLVTRETLREPGLSHIDFDFLPLSITGFETETQPAVNGYRLFFFWCCGGLAMLLFFWREQMAGRIEVGFLVIALSVGTLYSLSLPVNKVSWDEETHFEQAFWIANYRRPIWLSEPILKELQTDIDTWPYNQPGSAREQAALDAYLDEAWESGDNPSGTMWSANLNKTTAAGHISQGAALFLAQLFRLPFSVMFRIGRLGNLLVYSVLLYFAIKKTPVGKAILAFLGLMPEPLFLAGVYSYDPTILALLCLSFAWMLSAILEPGKTESKDGNLDSRVTWKAYGMMVIPFAVGCYIKPIYAPLLLVGLLIPSERFRSQRKELLMKLGFVAICGLLMLSFVLPFVLAPGEVGDARGGDTSGAGQLSYILGQPLTFARVLGQSMAQSLPSYVLGEKALGSLGHLGEISFSWILYAGSAAVILTGGRPSCGKRLNGWQKLWMFLLAAASAVLIWTSMYLAFTPPGSSRIEGVQGRYYLPFLFLLWLIMNPRQVAVRMKHVNYNGLTLGLAAGILLAVYYADVFLRYCR